MHRLLYLQCAIFTYTRITQLLTLVINLPLHNHKQDIGNIGIIDQFLPHVNFETNLRKKVHLIQMRKWYNTVKR